MSKIASVVSRPRAGESFVCGGAPGRPVPRSETAFPKSSVDSETKDTKKGLKVKGKEQLRTGRPIRGQAKYSTPRPRNSCEREPISGQPENSAPLPRASCEREDHRELRESLPEAAARFEAAVTAGLEWKLPPSRVKTSGCKAL